MAYIYCITNLINSKKYVGKTIQSIEKRFLEHCNDAKRERCAKRPLYDAFNKYGIENFIIEELEEVTDEYKLSEREIYWINELQTYGRTGYNATKGGDGSIIYDHNEILELYNLGYSVKQVSQKMGCDISTITKVLKAHNIKSRRSSKKINQYDLANNYIQTFDSTVDAQNWLLKYFITKNTEARKSILKCCKGQRNKAYGYKWKFKRIE